MSEADFYKPLITGANIEGFCLYRIADGGWDKKPFDIGGWGCAGEAVAIEVKLIQAAQDPEKPLPWRLFEPQQIQWLDALARKVTGLPLVILIDREERAIVYEIHTPSFRDLRAREFTQTSLMLVKGPPRVYFGWKTIPLRKMEREDCDGT